MKNFKLSIILLEVLLAIVILVEGVFGGGIKGDEVLSLNGLYRFKITEEYSDSMQFGDMSEISYINAEDGSQIVGNVIEKDMSTPEKFLEIQEKIVGELGESTTSEPIIITKKGKKTTQVNYKITQEDKSLYALIGIVEFEKSPDEFLAIVSTSMNEESILNLSNILKSINILDIDKDAKTIFNKESEPITVEISNSWKRFQRAMPYSFLKLLDKGPLYLYIISEQNPEIDGRTKFDELNQEFIKKFTDSSIYKKEKIEKLDGRTEYSIVYTRMLEGFPIYAYFTVIDFENSDVITVLTSDFAADNYENVESELTEIKNSIKLK